MLTLKAEIGRKHYRLHFLSFGVWERVASPPLAVSSSHRQCTVDVLIKDELARGAGITEISTAISVLVGNPVTLLSAQHANSWPTAGRAGAPIKELCI